ncbi:hypothetical protein SAMN05216223_102240 [Actinacidiphila yanglinensis]|uniref:UPF0182 protein SAMN05216223_102240 n=1 Tax=Actinacidiphila yanglinensis TaxID=310779 RepID=A0A1H5VEI7_9ACTN|nr:UPF0182 family protein [Actinacidiphila yanglinensis]SEF84907.1 hypothetical protein SAMN05216223_102240 [Actinacidiphila yanglinensis]
MPDRSGGRPAPRFAFGRPSRGTRTLLITVVVLAVLMVALVMLAGLWTDLLWYRSVHYSSVFGTVLGTKVALFCVFGLLMALAVGANLYLAHRLRPPLSAMSPEQQNLDRYRMGIAPYKKWVLIAVSTVVGLIAGGSATAQWRLWLLYVNATPFHTKDPQFHKDVSFYTFDLPWYRFLLAFGFAAVLLSLVAAVLAHYLYGGLRITSPGARATAAATGHLSVLLGLFVSLKAVAYWLDRYALVVKSSGLKATDHWTGMRYVDANAYLPAKTILFSIAVICALLFFATLWRRTWTLPTIGFGLMVLSAVLIGGLYPAIVQKFQVQPNEAAKEAPYIQRNIDATRAAYGIDHTVESDYKGTSKTPAAKLRADAGSAASIRVLDPNVVSPTFQQNQQSGSYYSFPSTLDVDRYTVDGKEQDTVVGVRELNEKGIPENNWINDHFKYTHGYGIVTAKGTTVTGNDPDTATGSGTGSGASGDSDRSGQPVYTEQGLPTTGALGPYTQEIYFGEQTKQYAIVDGPTKELDYAEKDHEVSTSYRGKGGVSLDSPITRAAYAVTFGEPKILYSGAIGHGSQILYNRTPKQRVEAVAPWLTIDGDPYPAVVGTHVEWIVDAYTTTDNYPYSSRTTMGDTTTDSLTDSQGSVVARQNRVNYIRNSVKATVDAYTGAVTLYQWDTKDPVLKTWMKAFPHTVKPKSAIPSALMAHLRYPQDLFKVQRQLLTQYHVTTATQFYSGSQVWQVPDDPASKSGKAVPPYYLSLKMPGQSSQEFSLTSTFAPNKRGNLAAFVAVDSDATSPDYGKMRLLDMPTDDPVDGPRLVQSKFNSDSAYAQQISRLRGKDSTIEYGNLLTLPLDGGLLYVEPVYLRGANVDYPLLKKVFVSFNGRSAFDDTLDEALDDVFGRQGSPPPASTGSTAQPPPAAGSADPAVEAALTQAQKAYDDAQAAMKKGDWKAYGDAQKRLGTALQQAEEAEKKAARAGKGATASKAG